MVIDKEQEKSKKEAKDMRYEIQEKIVDSGIDLWYMIAESDLKVEADRIVGLLNMWGNAEGHEYRVWTK